MGMLFMILIGFPIAIAIAILRYRLYDIDVVINKTLVFGTLAAFITGIYVAVVVGIGELLGSSDEPNLALSIAATAIVAIAFQPVRDRVERVANRLVYGIRRTPYEVLADFSDKVATSYETQEVTPAMAHTLREATGAARAEVWLALDSTLVLSASTETERTGDGVIALEGSGIDAIDADEVVPVTHQGELLGALAIAKDRAEPVTGADRRLLADLAAQAGIILRNARLTAELQARLDEISVRAEQIRESRRRIVATQDQARRRLERDIHDGAQQHLVALAVKLNLAKTMAERKPERAGAMLDQLDGEMGDALETLSDLARGIYPPLLRERGIAAALEARGGSVPFELSVIDRTSARADEATEAAVYFCCLEALQNVAKYAGATNVTVELDDVEGLSFSVNDDGRGFDPGAVEGGSGLQGMSDRLAAVGGVVEIDSDPGRGTTVRGRIGKREVSPA
jgi:signal transduction histidine kinase